MANWLQKILMPPAAPGKAVMRRPEGNVPAKPVPRTVRKTATLPNATIIYGIGASFLFVACFFLLTAGKWFMAMMVFLLGLCLVGFALHLLKHQD